MTRFPPFVFVTGNAGKRREAERLMGQIVARAAEDPGSRVAVPLESVALDLPEIQSLDLRAVLEAKAEAAWRELERPLLVDDTGLELDALGGFPGPMIKWLLESVGAAGISRLTVSLGEPRATVRCALLYADSGRRIIAEATVRGEIVSTPRGERGFGWDSVFCPTGSPGTYAELSDAVKDQIGHRGKAWRKLADELATISR